MGIYLNPGNKGFQKILRSGYVDKTGLIDLINRTIGTADMLTCVSRPRRFGKSYAAKMLCAYYDGSCDSRELFDDKEIAGTDGYLKHLNQYHVVSLDITAFISEAWVEGTPLVQVPGRIVRAIGKELTEMYPDLAGRSLTDAMACCVERTGKEFVFIIDEWDALIREAKGDAGAQQTFLNFLRGWFKNSSFTPKVVAAAYMTGILPIKKNGSQSAISDFVEYTILDPDGFARFTGFTEDEVRGVCEEYGMSFAEAKRWYDGYDCSDIGPVYNPYSVMMAMHRKSFGSYWCKTSAAESLMTYINMDFEGMQEIVTRLIAGEEIEVNPDSFENDFETFRSRDDVLTLLIHLGYLTWNREDGTVHIPNEEVRGEFRQILKGAGASPKWMELLARSRKLLEDTLAGNGDAVAEGIDAVRQTQYAPTFYNNEQALRYVIKFAFIAAVDQYMKVEELPSGKGIADVVYIPKQRSLLPALVIELKWNRAAGATRQATDADGSRRVAPEGAARQATAEGAIQQIKDKNYPAVA